MVRAKDAREHTSPWSDSLAVSVTYVEAPAKPDVAWELLNKGTALRLTWGTVANADWTAPDLMDTLLGGIRQFFVLSWAEIAQA
jgi:hypothetical protein